MSAAEKIGDHGDEPASERAEVSPASGITPSAAAPAATFRTAGHDVLFHSATEVDRACDVCGARVEDGDLGDGPAVPGRAFYLWVRGDETRREEPPLCPSCAAALGLTALARWEIEEEEG